MRKIIPIAVWLLLLQLFSIEASCLPAPGVKPQSFLFKAGGSVAIRTQGENITLRADNSTLEEILQKIAEEKNVVLQFFCQDPALKVERLSGIAISGSLIKILEQLMPENCQFAFFNQEGKLTEKAERVATINIRLQECQGAEQAVRVFKGVRGHPLLRKPPDTISLEELREVIKREGPACRRRAVDILKIKGEEKGIPYAQKALKDENPAIILAAANTLMALGHKHGFEKVADAIYARFQEKPYGELLPIMAEVDKEKIWAIIDRFMGQSGEGEKSLIVKALSITNDTRAIKYLITICSSKENSRQAINAMAKIGGPEAAKALMELLKGEDVQKQAWAAHAVPMLAAKDAVELRSEVERIVIGGRVSQELLKALTEVNYLEPIEKLMKNKAGKPEPKIQALKAMASKGSEKTIPVMRLGLKEKDSQVRLTSVEALTALAAEEAVPYLIEATSDEESKVRLGAVRGLSKFSVDDPIVAALGKAIQDPDESVRRAAVDALSVLGKPNEVMTSILKKCESDQDPYIVKKAGAILKLWQLK